MTTPQQTRLKHALSRSTWVTGGWNWLLTLVSRAAEAILTVTILYSTLQIFIETNPQVDLGMFLAQQIALDTGGIGLIKMANQAKRDGQPESARKARTVAIILMVLMGLGVVISEVESKISTTTTVLIGHHLLTTTLDFRHAYPGVAIVIEILLLVARGSMAIVYGFVIHDLESTQPEQQSAHLPASASGVEEVVRTMLEPLQVEQHQLLTSVQEIREVQHTLQRAESADATNDLVNTVTQRMRPLVDAWIDEAVRRASPLDEDALHQHMDALLTHKMAVVQQSLEAALATMQQREADLHQRVPQQEASCHRTINTYALAQAASPVGGSSQGASQQAIPSWLAGDVAPSAATGGVDHPPSASRDEVLQQLEADLALLRLSDRALAKKVSATASTARRAKAAYGVKHPEALHTLNQEKGGARETDELEAVQ